MTLSDVAVKPARSDNASMPSRTCQVLGCERVHLARGYCSDHYHRWRRHGDPLAGRPAAAAPPPGTDCVVDGCDRPRYQGHRYCASHTMRMHRYGDLEDHRRRRADVRVDRTGYLVEASDDPLIRWPSERATRQHRRVLLAKIGPGEHPCHWCGTIVSWDRTWPRDRDGLNVDHLDESTDNNDPANLVPSCGPCNAGRMGRGRKRGADWRWLPRTGA